MKKLDEILEGVRTVAVAGHVNPDGDCVGSAMGVYLYLGIIFPGYRQMYIWRERKKISLFFRSSPLPERKRKAERVTIC